MCYKDVSKSKAIVDITCSMLRGSFNATGMETWDKSFPMFLHRRFQRDNPSVSGRGVGSLVRRPVMHFILEAPVPPATRNIWKWAMKGTVSITPDSNMKGY
jgi:hypothetical protein